MKRYLITGGLGHIGSHVVDALIDRGDEVVVIDNLATGNMAFKNPKAEVLMMSVDQVLDAKVLAGKTFDGVFHLAAFSHIRMGCDEPLRAERNGANLTVAMLTLCVELSIPKFVFISSVAVDFNPGLPYSIEKAAGERHCAFFEKRFGLKTSIIRIHSVYGSPRQGTVTGNLVPSLLDQRQRLGKIQITGDGSQVRDFVYYTDAVNAILAAEHREGVSVIGTCEGHSVLELAQHFNCPIEFIGKPVVEAERQVCVKSDYPTLVSFSQGMARLALAPKRLDMLE